MVVHGEWHTQLFEPFDFVTEKRSSGMAVDAERPDTAPRMFLHMKLGALISAPFLCSEHECKQDSPQLKPASLN